MQLFEHIDLFMCSDVSLRMSCKLPSHPSRVCGSDFREQTWGQDSEQRSYQEAHQGEFGHDDLGGLVQPS